MISFKLTLDHIFKRSKSYFRDLKDSYVKWPYFLFQTNVLTEHAMLIKFNHYFSFKLLSMLQFPSVLLFLNL